MTDQQPVTPSSPSTFYAVTWGRQRGVFGNYMEARAAMKGFPSPTLKKFKNREEAESFVKRSEPESTSMDVDDSFTKFFAVARGRIVGIFKDMETVKKNTKGYPNAMHKKFDTLGEAQHYLEKYFEGKADEKKTPKSSRTSAGAKAEEEAMDQTDGETEEANVEDAKDGHAATDELGAKPVARKRTYGTKVNDERDDDGAKLDSSAGHKELRGETTAQGRDAGADAEMRDEAGIGEKQGEKDVVSTEEEEAAVNGEQQQSAPMAAKSDEKIEEGEAKQHKTAGEDGELAKKAKLSDNEGEEQASQQ